MCPRDADVLQWRLIKFLKDNFNHDLKLKKFKEDGDVCSTYLWPLIRIYEYYGEDEKLLNGLRADAAVYKGLQNCS